VTAYDRQTHALIKNVPREALVADSRIAEERGRLDQYLHRAEGAVRKGTNWLPTDPNRKFELMASFYAPKPEFFEKKWILPDVEKVAAQ
jgi:hypothetical protein